MPAIVLGSLAQNWLRGAKDGKVLTDERGKLHEYRQKGYDQELHIDGDRCRKSRCMFLRSNSC